MGYQHDGEDDDEGFESRVLHLLHGIADTLRPLSSQQSTVLSRLDSIAKGQQAMTDQFTQDQSDLDAKIADVLSKVSTVAADVTTLLGKVSSSAALQASADAEVVALKGSTASLQSAADALAAIDTSVQSPAI